MRKSRFIFVASGLLGVLLGTGAFAQGVPSEIVAYNAIAITFSENAHKCNLKDIDVFAERVREKLASIGVNESGDSIVTVNVGISGNSFGPLGVQCASQAELAFQTTLSAENIVTDNPAVRDAVDRLKQFPITLYKTGMFGVQRQVQPAKGGSSTTSQDAVLGMIDGMVDRFASAR